MELTAVALSMTALLLSCQEVKEGSGTMSRNEWGQLSSSEDLSLHRLLRGPGNG